MRTAWLASLAAQARGHRFILRMDDLDPQAVKPGAIQRQLDDLDWLGIEFDEGPNEGGSVGPYAQSQRFSMYDEVLKTLNERRLLYPCWCSRKEVLAAALAPHESDESPLYAHTCKPNRPQSLASLETPPIKRGRSPALRLDVTEAMRQLKRTEIEFTDLVYGTQRMNPITYFGDFVIRRVDGVAAYQLACAFDDWHMQCSLVLRGADLLKSTGRQLLLFLIMNWQVPEFAHVGLVQDSFGQRLAKRDQAISIHQLREKDVSVSDVQRVLRETTYPDGSYTGNNDFILDERLRDPVRLPEVLPWSTRFK